MKLYGGNCLETPVYWYRIEPEMDCYDFSMVKDVIEEAREAGLHLILLWFGTSKNGHPNYVPEYIKLQPDIYRLAQGPDGAPVPSLSVHCRETLERDKKAFGRFMEFLKEADGESRTVLAVQIENEMGYANTDMDYSAEARRDYEKPVPGALAGVELPDSGRELIGEGKKLPPGKDSSAGMRTRPSAHGIMPGTLMKWRQRERRRMLFPVLRMLWWESRAMRSRDCAITPEPLWEECWISGRPRAASGFHRSGYL